MLEVFKGRELPGYDDSESFEWNMARLNRQHAHNMRAIAARSLLMLAVLSAVSIAAIAYGLWRICDAR
jgi:predicted Co/Zn/Cd cation transporter (cation efflux family)